MKTFQFKVYETVTTLRLYTVEAETREEAENKAVIGDTTEEEALSSGEVTNRVLA